jgi:hypothetical protein
MYKAISIVGLFSIVMIVCVRSNQGNQENSSDPAALQKICEEALGHIAKGENEQGLSLLREYYSRPLSDVEHSYTVKSFGEYFKSFCEKCGNSLNYELLEEKKVSDSLQKRTYLLKFDRNVMRFVFVFYRAHDSWKILEMHFDDQLGEIVK